MLHHARIKRVLVAVAAIAGLAGLGWMAAAQAPAQQLPGPEPAQIADPGVMFSTQSITLAISQTGKTAYAYSTHTGKWEKVRIVPPDISIVPTVSSEIACFIHGNRAYAFGGLSGRWDVVNLPGLAEPTVGSDWVRIDVGTSVYMFSSTAGKWAAVDLAAD